MASPALSTSSTVAPDRYAAAKSSANSRNSSAFRLILSSLIESLSPIPLFYFLLNQMYQLYQSIVSAVFATPYRPIPSGVEPYGRIAIIGAGLTGIATAAAFVSHGFEVVIYDSDDKIGGIWSRVNKTSSLQLNSFMYRFHPSIRWSCGFPRRDEILSQINHVVDKYHLGPSLGLSTPVHRVARHPDLSTAPKSQGHARWIINNGEDGVFDAVVGAIGSCGDPKYIELKGHRSFAGEIYHSSQLDNADLAGKRVVIIGSGASGVESAELAVEKQAKDIKVLAREDKWIIPRNTAFDILLALKPYGAETRLSFIPEWFIRTFHYRDQIDLSPSQITSKGLFEGTPIVNNEFLEHVRSGLIDYKRGDVTELTSQGVKFVERSRHSKPGQTGDEFIEQADVIVLATGYTQPSVDILPEDLFPVEGDRSYARPNLYLQNFSTEDWSVLLTNAAYKNAIGSVGNFHIGIYARLLMVFLYDQSTRPSPRDMKTWVDVISYLKVSSFGPDQNVAALDFFTYTELMLFVIAFHIFRISRIKWLPFVLFGFGLRPPTVARFAQHQKSE